VTTSAVPVAIDTLTVAMVGSTSNVKVAWTDD